MKNIILNLKIKEYPELKLTIEINYQKGLLIFSGNATPSKYVKGYHVFLTDRIDNIGIRIISASYPAVYLMNDKIELYIGGIEKNRDHWVCSSLFGTSDEKTIMALIKDFRKINLNTNIQIL